MLYYLCVGIGCILIAIANEKRMTQLDWYIAVVVIFVWPAFVYFYYKEKKLQCLS